MDTLPPFPEALRDTLEKKAEASQPSPSPQRGKDAVADMDALVSFAVKHDVSDIHITANSPIHVRIAGKMKKLNAEESFRADQVEKLIRVTMTDEQWDELCQNKEIDFAYKSSLGTRFRVNAYLAQGNLEAVMRVINTKVRTVPELRLPESIKKFAQMNDGLILVAGATGSGKSSTLASVIHDINLTKAKRIITIENPVEILHTNRLSVISQREIGDDSISFANALRSLLRQNPDIILIGEIRDKETADSAIQAAQTGHLVLSTIHASTAEETIKRFASLYPVEERSNVKRNLAYSLKGILVQRLINDIQGKKIPALEIMFHSHRIKEALLAEAEERTGESLTKIISESKIDLMSTMDQYLMHLVAEKEISVDVAMQTAVNAEELKQMLSRAGIAVRR